MKRGNVTQEVTIETLGYYLDRALFGMIRLLNHTLAGSGLDLKHSQFTVLEALSVKNGISQTELSKILGKDPAAISRTLNYLEKKNYIVRESANGSRNRVLLTDKGKEIVPKLKEIADKVTEIGFTGFRESKKAETMKSLTKIYHNTSLQ